MESPSLLAASDALDDPYPTELLSFPKSRLTRYLEKLDSQMAEDDQNAGVTVTSDNREGYDTQTDAIEDRPMPGPFESKQEKIGPAPKPLGENISQLVAHFAMLRDEIYDTVLSRLYSAVPGIMKYPDLYQTEPKQHLERLLNGDLMFITEWRLQNINEHLMTEIAHLQSLTTMYQNLPSLLEELSSLMSENQKRMEEIKPYRLTGDFTCQLRSEYRMQNSRRESLHRAQAAVLEFARQHFMR